MTTTSTSALDGNRDRWSLICDADKHPTTGSTYTKWHVKGPRGLYGPFYEAEGEQLARDLIAKKVGVPVAAGQRPDAPPVEAIGPYAPDNPA